MANTNADTNDGMGAAGYSGDPAESGGMFLQAADEPTITFTVRRTRESQIG